MSLPPHLGGLVGLRHALVADLQGQVLEASEDDAWRADLDGAAAAATVTELEGAGAALGLAGLELVHVKAGSRTSLTARGPDAICLVEVEHGQRTAEAEKALSAWAAGEPPPPAAGPASVAPPPALGTAASTRPLEAPPGQTVTTLPAVTGTDAPAGAPWSPMRRALSRGLLTEAAALLRAASELPVDTAAQPEAAVPDRKAFREASQQLLEGVGSVLAGDTAGGARALRDLAAPAQPNLSVRWLAAFWCAKAALVGGSVEVARRHVKDALDLSRQLDVEARAMSQLAAAELLLRAGEQEKALAWLAESRSRFERGHDGWGQAQAWLVEARVRAEAGSAEACVAAARRAQAAEPAWDGPAIFQAGRALAAGDLDGAEALLAPFTTAAARRVLKVVEAVRQGAIGQGDGAEFLRLHLAPPTTAAMRALERIADASPRFLQAREAQAWMLVKLGRYGSARGLFAWLDGQALDPDDRALVSLGLRCVDAATGAGKSGQAPPPPASPGAPPPDVEETPLPRAVTGATDAGAVFSGRLSVFALPDLVEFLRSARRSGLLVCSSAKGMGTMRFRQGYLTGGSATAVPRLADLLLRAGQLSSEAQRAVADLPPGSEDEEAVLQRDGLVAPAAIEAAARQRIELTVRELVRWRDGEFVFNKEGTAEDHPPPVMVDAQELLLNLFKELDEASREPARSGGEG